MRICVLMMMRLCKQLMNGYKSSLYNRNVYLILLATLVLPTMSNAEIYDFKVVYAEVPALNDKGSANELLPTAAQRGSNSQATFSAYGGAVHRHRGSSAVTQWMRLFGRPLCEIGVRRAGRR